MRGVPSGAAIDARSPVRIQAGFGTLKFPEWTSRRAASSSSVSARIPRAPNTTVGPLARVLRPIRHQDEVRRQEVPVGLDQGAEARAPDLLLALEDELQVDPGRDAEGVHQGQRLEVGPDRALVVGRASRVEPVRRQRVVRHLGGRHDRRALLRQAGAERPARTARAGATRPAAPASCRSGSRSGGSAPPRAPAARRRRRDCRSSRARAPPEPAALHGVRQPARAGPDPRRLLAHGVDPETLDEALEDGPATRPGARWSNAAQSGMGSRSSAAATRGGRGRPGRSGGCARASTRSRRRRSWRPRRGGPGTRAPWPGDRARR